MAKKYWLFKSEPNAYSINDMQKDRITYWDGVRNYQARNFIRDEMKKGDKVLFYHSNAKPNAVVGICEIIKEAYPDFTAFDPDNKHFDPKSKTDEPAWFMVDIKFFKKFTAAVTLEEIKVTPELKKMRLVQRGNRLSVFPIEKIEFETIEKMGK